MDKITSFGELGLLLQETKWGQEDNPLAKLEGDLYVFLQKNKRVDRREKFRFKLGDQDVEYTAEQIVYTYRTREQDLKTYLRENPRAKKLSTLHRPNFLNLFNDLNALQAASSASARPSDITEEEERERKRERLDAGGTDDRKADKAGRADVSARGSAPTRLVDVMKMEVRYFDRNASLNAVRSFQEVIDLDARSKAMEEEHQKRGLKQKKAKFMGSPIIIVPPNATAVLNLFNIKQFLEDMSYVSAEEIMSKNPSEQKPEFVYVTRRKHPQAGDIRFKVVDSFLNFDDATWDRVVAVMVSGQAWQLKGWKKWSTPADIFANVKGLHVYFDDAKISDQVKGWNVSALPIKHQSRNKDIIQVHEIWRQIDAHMQRKKPQLLQSLVDEHEARMRAEREARQKGMQAQMEDEEDEEEGDYVVRTSQDMTGDA
jgi:hypothetical protein